MFLLLWLYFLYDSLNLLSRFPSLQAIDFLIAEISFLTPVDNRLKSAENIYYLRYLCLHILYNIFYKLEKESEQFKHFSQKLQEFKKLRKSFLTESKELENAKQNGLDGFSISAEIAYLDYIIASIKRY
ncbi:MAG: hypothetical protein ABIA04_02095 [Pseudomonadota bacterium]